MFFNVYFIRGRGMGVDGVLWSTVLGWGLPALVYGVATAPRLRWRFDGAVARRMIRFSLPLVPFALVTFTVAASGRLFLQHSHGREAVGIFSAANRVALILSLLCVTPFQTAWGYLGLDFVRLESAREIFSRAFTYLLLVGLGCFLLALVAGRELILLFGKTYYLPALPYVDMLMAGYLMLLFFYWGNVPLVAKDKTHLVLLLSLPAFIVAVGGGWLVIPHYGIRGACGVFVAGLALQAGATGLVGGRMVGFRPETVRVLKILVAFAIPYGIGRGLLAVWPGGRLAIELGQLGGFPLLLGLFGFLTRGEIERLREFRRYLPGSQGAGR
jgi:O-antigen/teichoic acid export membrane protein